MHSMEIMDRNTGVDMIQVLNAEIRKAIIGQDDLVLGLDIAVLTGGNLSVTGKTGLGKTQGCKALAEVIGGTFGRVQGTEDVTASDITGNRIFIPGTTEWTFEPGPVFSDVVLIDEGNRLRDKAQNALNEVMAERQVTVGTKRYTTPRGQVLVITSNPSDHAGTEEFTDAIDDRCIAQIDLGYPTLNDEYSIAVHTNVEIDKLTTVLTMDHVRKLQELTEALRSTADPEAVWYAVQLVRKTREDKRLVRGAGPRGSIDIMKCAAAYNIIKGENAKITIDHVRAVATMVLRHRLETKYDVDTPVDTIIQEML